MGNTRVSLKGIAGHLFVLVLFLAVFACSLAMRTFVFKREEARIGNCYSNYKDELPLPSTGPFIPFFVESSIMYAYSADVAYGKGIPSYDRLLPTNKNVKVVEQDTVGLEYFLGYGYRIKNMISPSPEIGQKDQVYEDNPYFTNWARSQIRFWASTISALIFLLLIVLRCPWKLALAGGLLHAVSPAGIARYTGQDIVRGEFCMPFIILALVIAFWYLGRPSRLKLILFGITAFVAISTWDMCQIFFGVWGISEIFRLIIGGRPSARRMNIWIAIFIAVLAASVLIPYHRVHRLFFSPLVLVIIPAVIIASSGEFRLSYLKRFGVLAITIAVTVFAWWGISKMSSFSDSYGHFGKLLVAKLQFMNVKPADPLLLNFDARILWTPAMHSADMRILREFFPFAIYAAPFLLILGLFLKKHRRRLFMTDMPRLYFPLFMTVFYFTAFIFIVRYHSFAIVFLSVLLPLIFHDWLRNIKHRGLQFVFMWGGLIGIFLLAVISLIPKHGFVISSSLWIVAAVLLTVFAVCGTGVVIALKKYLPGRTAIFEKVAVCCFLGLVIFVEFAQTFCLVRNYDNYYLPETAGLMKWMRAEGVENEVYMADFGLSPLLKAYCHAAVILQPKFELGETRKNVEQYMNEIFHGTERNFSKFCVDKGARYYIFDRGHAGDMTIYSSRYCAAAMKIKVDSPVNLMYAPQNRDKLKWFYEIEPPPGMKFVSSKYVVFKIISEEDRRNAQQWVKDAQQAINTGNFPMASRLAKAAAYADPIAPNVRILYAHVFGKVPDVRLRGF